MLTYKQVVAGSLVTGRTKVKKQIFDDLNSKYCIQNHTSLDEQKRRSRYLTISTTPRCLTMTSCNDVLEHRVGRCRVVHLLTAAIILVTLGVTAVIIVTLSPVAEPNKMSATGGNSSEDCIDVAVIGAGIGGAYTGWRLKDRGLSISVFEYSDRVGGRLFTKELPVAPGTYLDFGGMRFLDVAHQTLNRTAIELGLKIIPFEQGFGHRDETIWYTRGKRMRNTDLGTSNVPYKLQPHELKSLGTIVWDILNNNVNLSSNTFPSIDEMYSLTTTDGTPLYKMSMDNFYGRYTSREVYQYLYDISGWAKSVGKIGALQVPKQYTSYPGDRGGSGGVKTIAGGMGMVPKSLVEKFKQTSTSHKLHLNHQLMRIEKRNAGGYHLTFRRTQTTDGITTPIQTGDTTVKICARKVILATQKRCIEEIDFAAFQDDPEIVKNFNSVQENPAGRIYLAYRTKWWKKNSPNITHSRSYFPNRQTYDWSTGTNNVSILMASYHDGDMVNYWRELSQFGTPIPGSLPGANAVTDVVKERLEKYLRPIYNYTQEDIPEAVGGGMMLWDSYPFHAGWSHYKPGFDERKVREIIKRPSPSDDVYIVSGSWPQDNLQGWSEGSLVAVDQVIEKYF